MVGTMAKIDDSIKKKVPELRFKGFTDDWEQRKLTEIVNRVNKSSNSDVLPKVEFEDIVSGEGRLNKDISSKFDSRKGTLFEPENILYGKLRPYLKNWLFSDFEGVALGDFWVFEATDVSVPSFDYYLIQSDNYQKVANDTSGTKMPRSDWKNVSSTDFAIPSKDEQKQIGAFFKQLDNTIVLHQRRLDLLKEQKKGYLQKMFPKNGAKVPELRFAGFADDWEERKLKELGEIQTGNTPPTSDSDNYSLDGVLWVTPTDIKSLVISNTAKKLSQVGVTKARIAKAGSILVTSIASIGKNTLLRMDAGFNQQINSLTPTSENDSYFLLTQSEKWSEKMKQTAASATMQIVNKTDFSNISTYVPVHKEEQEKIGAFFKQLDDTIDLHQRKLDLLKEQKKGFLQKMFI